MIAGLTGEWFLQKRGIHQGGPLSMMLYAVFINDLLIKMRENECGVCIKNINLTDPTHADDISILALYKINLNALLDIAYSYSLKWRYHFNMSKTVYMVSGNYTNPWCKCQIWRPNCFKK